jgi:hypothetical protein
VNKESQKFWSWTTFKNEIIFFVGLGLSLVLLLTVGVTEYIGLLGSLTVMVCLSIYYSLTFFKDDASWENFYFYMAIMPFLIGYFALIYKAFGVVTPDSINSSVQLNWLDSFYFSIVTWTTLGYGDFRPSNDETKIFVMTEVLLGYIYMGLFIGKLLILGLGKQNGKTK